MIGTATVLRGLEAERTQVKHEVIAARAANDYAAQLEAEALLAQIDLRITRVKNAMGRAAVEQRQRRDTPGLGRVLMGMTCIGLAAIIGGETVAIWGVSSGATLFGWGVWGWMRGRR